NNGADATNIAANASHFTMHTGLAYLAAYDITVGVQPYGISQGCTPGNASGTVSSDVMTVTVVCSSVTPVQKVVAGYFGDPRGAAVDAAGNVFVNDSIGSVMKIPYSQGQYGTPVSVVTGLPSPRGGIAIDSAGNLFVTTFNAVMKIPYNQGSYGT